MQIMYRIIFDKHAVFALFSEMCWPAVWLHSNAADSREGGPSVTRGGYLLTLWNMATLLVGRSVVISTVEMSKVCFVVDYRATLSLSALLRP